MSKMGPGVVAILGMLLLLFSAIPAVADAPMEFEITRVLEGETDPCTGETIDVYFTWQAREHVHNNNVVTRFDGYAETSNGYVANGTENQVINKKWLTTTFNWMNIRETDGNRYSVKGHVKIDLETGEFTIFDVDNFRCMGS